MNSLIKAGLCKVKVKVKFKLVCARSLVVELGTSMQVVQGSNQTETEVASAFVRR